MNKETAAAENGRMVLRVRMFGGFSLEYAGRPLSFARSSNTKFIQLLQLLLLNPGTGMPKKELIDTLYELDSGVNKNKNLNNVIYRLKKQLVSAGLPEEDYIFLEGGRCRFQSSFPVKVDALCLEQRIREAQEAQWEQKCQYLRDIEYLYNGEFLPEFSTEMWVIERSIHYKKLYVKAITELGTLLHADRNYAAERLVYRKAAKIYPYEDWQAKEMDCLLEAKEYEEAYQVYQDTVRTYCEDMGLPPSGELLARLHRMEEQMTHPVGSFEDIKRNFQETQGGGAYYCHYPSFLDSCHLLARIAQRSGQSIYLMLCSLTEKGRKDFSDREKLEAQMQKLKGAIQEALRRGDLYTRYSKNQFLIILVGTGQESCSLVFDRLIRKWKAQEGAKGELEYSVASLLQMMDPDLVIQDQKPTWGKFSKKWGS